MAKIIKGRSSRSYYDKDDSYIEGLRDNIRGDYSSESGPAKKVRVHHVPKDDIEVSEETSLRTLEEAARKGYWQSQLMLAQEYFKRGREKAGEHLVINLVARGVKDPRLDKLIKRVDPRLISDAIKASGAVKPSSSAPVKACPVRPSARNADQVFPDPAARLKYESIMKRLTRIKAQHAIIQKEICGLEVELQALGY